MSEPAAPSTTKTTQDSAVAASASTPTKAADDNAADSSSSSAGQQQQQSSSPSDAKADEAALKASNSVSTSPEDLENRVSPEDNSYGPPPSFDDFKNLKDGIEPFIKPKTQVKEEVKPEVTAKPETAPQVTKQAADKAKPVAAATTQTGAVKRDYAGFSEEEQGLLSKTSNETFNYIRPKLLENKTLANVLAEKDKQIADLKAGKTQLPDSYFEHPHGFVLTPDFNQASSNLQQASSVSNYWKSQLVAIRKGEDWQDLTGVNDKGQLVLGAKKPATAEAEAEIMDYINHASMQVNKFQEQLFKVQTGFSERHKAAVDSIKQAEKQYFQAYEDDKHPMQPVIKNIFNSIPVEFRANPLASMLAKSAAGMVQLNNVVREQAVKITEYENKLKAYEKTGAVIEDKNKRNLNPNESDTQAAGSTPTNRNGAATANDNVKFDDFLALKNRG